MANDDEVVRDGSEGDGEHDDSEILWFAPAILSPSSGSTVAPGFEIHAAVTMPAGLKWNIDICIGDHRLRRYSGVPELGVGIYCVVDADLIPRGAAFYFKVEYWKGIGWSEWAWSGDLKMADAAPPPPQIRGPAQGSSHVGSGQLTGTCLPGATVTAVFVNGNPPQENVYVNGTEWAYTYYWPPGKHQFQMKQTVNWLTSDLTGIRTFYIKPPVPTLVNPPEGFSHTGASRITGTCMAGASVLVTDADGKPLASAYMNGTEWDHIYDWGPGTYQIRVKQTINGQSSDLTGIRTFYIKPPVPILVNPTEGFLHIGKGRITGSCMPGATVQVTDADGNHLANAYMNGTEWDHIYDWAPGRHQIRVKQTFNGQSSDLTGIRTFYIKPPVPLLVNPTEGLSHTGKGYITGSCMSGATVQVTDADGNHLAEAYMYGTEWDHIYYWAPGRHQIRIKQTFNGQSSDLTGVRTFYIKPAKPVIMPPPEPAELNQALSITGVWNGTVSLAMFTEEGVPIAGEFTDSGETRIFTPTANWAFGTTTVKVVQTVNTVDSDPSELITVRVKLLAPQITTPKEGEIHLAVEVQGTCEPGATVTVWSGETNLGTTEVVGTKWTNRSPWTPGSKVVHAKQTVAGVESDASVVVNFKIKPAKPTISPPPDPAATDEALTITGVFLSGAVTLQMFTKADTPVPGAFTGSGTTRTFLPTDDWALGDNTVKVVQTVNAVDSDPSDECTFSVEKEEEGEKPDVPEFTLPRAGTKTSTRPTIRVSGLAGALHTVRLEHGATLHADKADAHGTLEFTVETPLVPGTNALQVKQKKAGGPASDWSEARQFSVKELPKIPTIDVPQQEALASRKPLIRGKGETRGEILLRHAGESKEPIATFTGVTSWRWTAKEAWPLGHYTIEAQQTDDGDCSEWSETRSFEVVDSLYAISDATPVIGNPVVGSGQSVKLRVQVVFGDTGEAAEGVKVEWRIKGKEDVLATTVTDSGGWAHYAYTPETDGKSEVVADITSDNDGVVMTELYEVNAQLQDAWAPRVTLYLDAWPVDLSRSDLVLVAGQTYRLRIALRENSHLWGSTITLEDVWGAAERGLTFVPALGTPQKVEANALSWSISSAQGQSGIFGLKLTSPVLPDWQLPGQVITPEMAQSVDVDLDTFPQVFGGEAACPCLGATHTITVRPKPDSPWLNHPVRLFLTYEAADLGVTVSPVSYQTMGANGVSWSLDCVNSSKSGNFVLWLESQLWGSRFPEMPMFLGNNKVEITEKDGPRQIAERWRYGVRVVSAFTKQPAGDVPVTVTVSGSEDVHRTQSDGWIYVHYDDGQVVSFTIHNGYDGSTVTG